MTKPLPLRVLVCVKPSFYPSAVSRYPFLVDENLIIAIIFMIAGVIGCFVPVLPGPSLAWLGALYYGWQTDWATISPLILGLLLVIALVGATADWWMSALGAKKGGASAWSQVAAMFGGIVGFFVFSLPGMIIGSVAAIVAVEWHRLREWKGVLRAGGGYLVGFLLAMIVEFVCTLLIIGIFAVRLAL